MPRSPLSSRITHSKRRKQRPAGRRRMLVEALESRRLLAADDGNVGSGDPAPYLFQIQQSGAANQIRIVVEEESLLVWDEVAQSLLDQIPLECITEINVTGSLDPDELIVDFQGGDFTVPINYDGADPTTEPGDSLTLVNGETESVTHQLQDFASGEIIATGTALNQLISYDGLEPINDALLAANRSFFFLGGDETIQFSDDTLGNNDNFNLIDSTASESIRFRNPTNSLLIDSGDGIDNVTVGELDLMTSFPTMTVNAGIGNDQVDVLAIPATVSTTVDGEAGDDRFVVGNLGSLDLILGNLTIAGGDQVPGTNNSGSVSAKAVTVTATIAAGDTLVVDDSASPTPGNYTIDSTSVTRAISPMINYATIEELTVLTGTVADTVNVLDINAATSTSLSTGNGADAVTVGTTADESLLVIDTGAQNDSITVMASGARSVALLTTGAGQDDIFVATTGDESGLGIESAGESDLVTVGTTGALSATRISTDAGEDIVNVRGTGINSAAEIVTGTENDVVNISSDAAGNRLDPSPNLMGDLSGIASQICIDAGDNDLLPETTLDVSAIGNTVSETHPSGDLLNLSDQGSVGANTYSLEDFTPADDLFRKAGQPEIIHRGVETLNVETSSGDDTVTLQSTGEVPITNLWTIGGADVVTVDDTGVDSIVVVDTGLDDDSVTVTQTGQSSILQVNSRAGEDDVSVSMTGPQSGVAIVTGSESDVVSIAQTGVQSVTAVQTNDGGDIINLQSTGTDSSVNVYSGTGNDTINVSSDADGDRINNSGDPSGTLDGLLGQIRISANSNDPLPTGSETVTAKGLSVTATVEQGDQLNISDQGSVSDNTYTLAANSFEKAGLPPIVFVSVETVSIETGSGNDTLTVIDTVDVTNTALMLMEGDDTVTIDDTGDDSILVVATGIGNDAAVISNTGDRSVTRVETFDGQDDVTVVTTGVQSGIEIETGNGIDLVSILATGNQSATLVRTGSSDDIVNLQSTAIDSVTEILTDAGNDTINVSSDADGDRINPSGDPAGSLDGILGLVCVDGNGNPMTPQNSASVTAVGQTVSLSLAVGDTLNISDQASVTNNTYTLSDTEFLKNGVPPIAYAGIETLIIETGSGDDNFTVTTTNDRTTTSINTDGGADNVLITTTGVQSILNVDTESGKDTIAVTETGIESVTLIDSGDDNDTVDITTSGLDSGLEILTDTGSDAVTLTDTGAATDPGGTTAVFVDTAAGADDVDVIDTGNRSALEVTTGSENDTVDITTTGTDSVSEVRTDLDDDDIAVSVTGIQSGLTILSGEGSDVIGLDDTGSQSVVAIESSGGVDVVNVQATGSASNTGIDTGDGSDTINVTSTADGTRLDPTGNQNGTVNSILGQVVIEGGVQDNEPDFVGQSEARQTDGDVITQMVSVTQGDTLNLSDAGNAVGGTYAINQTAFERSSVQTGIVTFATVETINLQTSTGGDTLAVVSTPDDVLVQITTHGGADAITIDDTGASSAVVLDTGADDDSVTIGSSGSASDLEITTTGGQDSLDIRSIGDRAGIEADLGSGNDELMLSVESNPPTRTGDAIINVRGSAGSDLFQVSEVFLMTVVDLRGDADNDLFELSASDSDANGYLRPLNDPAGTLDDTVAASRQLFIDGGDNAATLSGPVQQGASVSPAPALLASEETLPAVEIGDRIVVDAASVSAPLDLRYVITGPAAGVFATTQPGVPRQTVGNEVFETAGIEDVEVLAGTADDVMTLSSEVAIDIDQTSQQVSFDGGGGIDKFEVQGTAGGNQITIGNLQGDYEPIEIGNVEFLRVAGSDGNDQIVNRTSVQSVIDGLDGSDIVLGGSGRDLIAGGDGADFLYARGGNDILFTDQDLGDNTEFVLADEVIDGGFEDSVPPGDVCVQLDADFVRNCELLSDGGGIKDVLTWLRGIFVEPGEIQFSPQSPLLDPFEPAFAEPAETLAVSEPSKLPFGVSPPLSGNSFTVTTGTVGLPQATNSMDTNGDGSVTPADALVVINTLAATLPGGNASLTGDLRGDVNGNGTVEPRDALQIINFLARQPAGGRAEAEPVSVGSIGRQSFRAWTDAVDDSFEDDEDWLLQETGELI